MLLTFCRDGQSQKLFEHIRDAQKACLMFRPKLRAEAHTS